MTNQEAITILRILKNCLEPSATLTDSCKDVYEALDLAIQSLQMSPMLDAIAKDELRKELRKWE